MMVKLQEDYYYLFLLSILLSWIFFNKNIRYSKFSLLLIICLTSYSFVYIYSQSIKDEYINKYTSLAYNVSNNKITKLIKNKTLSDYFNYKNKFFGTLYQTQEKTSIFNYQIYLLKIPVNMILQNAWLVKKYFFNAPIIQ